MCFTTIRDGHILVVRKLDNSCYIFTKKALSTLLMADMSLDSRVSVFVRWLKRQRRCTIRSQGDSQGNNRNRNAGTEALGLGCPLIMTDANPINI